MNEETTKKPRKTIGPVEIFADDGAGVRTKLAMTPPAGLKSTDAIVRWIKANAQVDGVYAVQRTLARVKITKKQVEQTSAELV